MSFINKRYIDEKEASVRYSYSRQWFQRKRWEGTGPKFLKINSGKILYPLHETDEWFAAFGLQNLIGHPELMIVKTTFGFYVSDLVNFVQIFLITECRDSTKTRNNLDRLTDWLKIEKDFAKNIVKRARSRMKILKVVNSACNKPSPKAG